MAREICLRKHETSFIMLNSHHSLVGIKAIEAACNEDVLVLQIWECDDDSLVRLALKSHLTVPGHVLDCHNCTIGRNIKVKSAVGAVAD